MPKGLLAARRSTRRVSWAAWASKVASLASREVTTPCIELSIWVKRFCVASATARKFCSWISPSCCIFTCIPATYLRNSPTMPSNKILAWSVVLDNEALVDASCPAIALSWSRTSEPCFSASATRRSIASHHCCSAAVSTVGPVVGTAAMASVWAGHGATAPWTGP